MAPCSRSSTAPTGTRSLCAGRTTRVCPSRTPPPTPTVPRPLQSPSPLPVPPSSLCLPPPAILPPGLHQSGGPHPRPARLCRQKSRQLLAGPAPPPQALPGRQCGPHWRFLSPLPPPLLNPSLPSDPLRPHPPGAPLRVPSHRHPPDPPRYPVLPSSHDPPSLPRDRQPHPCDGVRNLSSLPSAHWPAAGALLLQETGAGWPQVSTHTLLGSP
jgi:hypothetical protein